MRWGTFPALCSALLLAGGILSGCDDLERTEQRFSGAAPLAVEADGTESLSRQAPRDAPEGSEDEGGGWNGERASRLAADTIERSWEYTKSVARQTVEAWSAAPEDGAESILSKIWEETKDRARRGGEFMKEAAAAADYVLDMAWQHTQDAAKRTRDAWSQPPADDDHGDEAASEVRL